jgi:hypothetical protein
MYITPVVDRDAADIAAQNSKAYFNVADWTRIYGNARLASALAAIMLDDAIAFDEIAAPAITDFPDVADFNTLLGNINNMVVAMAAELPTLTEVKDDWQAGASNPSPNYNHANQWEQTIDAIWDHWAGDSLEVCPNLTGNVTVGSGQTKIYVDCVNTNGHSITVNSGGVMHII